MPSCQFGRYRYKQLPFGTAPTGNMFQRKIDGICEELSDVFGIADNILVVGYNINGRDHKNTQQRVLHIGRKENLKLHTYKCLFRCALVPFLVRLLLCKM